MTNATRLLITGERRSGTTLMANLLNATDRITVYRDFLHIARLSRIIGATSFITPLTTTQKKSLVHHFESAEITCRVGTVSAPPLGQFQTLIDFYTGVLDQIAHPDDLVVGHKTTSAHSALGTLLRHVPRLRVVYMLRDPRDVTLSAVKRFPHQSWSVHVDNWRTAYETMALLLASGDTAQRIRVVRFDHLLTDPDDTLSSLAHFLDLDEIRKPDTMTDYGQVWQDNSSFGDVRPAGAHGGLDTAPVGRWREQDPILGRRVELLLHDLMADAGFALSAPVDEDEQHRARREYRIDRLARAPRILIDRARRKLRGGAA